MRVFCRWESNKGGGKRVGISHHLLSGIEWRKPTKPQTQLKRGATHSPAHWSNPLALPIVSHALQHDYKSYMLCCWQAQQILSFKSCMGPIASGICSKNHADETILLRIYEQPSSLRICSHVSVLVYILIFALVGSIYCDPADCYQKKSKQKIKNKNKSHLANLSAHPYPFFSFHMIVFTLFLCIYFILPSTSLIRECYLNHETGEWRSTSEYGQCH